MGKSLGSAIFSNMMLENQINVTYQKTPKGIVEPLKCAQGGEREFLCLGLMLGLLEC